ncbi:MAG: IgGFc-binding protein [Deltaproteobacteria bacterium]|nr:IgGFc-binding protein [Deltaproteobacteria bacterium]
MGCPSSAPPDDDDATVAADDDDDTTDTDDDADDDDATPACVEGATTCAGPVFRECRSGAWTNLATCGGPSPLCDPDRGCLACTPETFFCSGDDVMSCVGDGRTVEYITTCAHDTPCVAGACTDLCATAEAQLSYLGCDFLAVSTANVTSTTFNNNFAVVVGNPASSPTPAQVTVRRDGVLIASRTVGVGQTSAIELPMVLELKAAIQSAVVPGGAYEVQSNVPVAAYQFNPLDFELQGADSLSNDASLLLPEHTLTGDYVVSTWPTFGLGGPDINENFTWYDFSPGFFAVAATADDTLVTIGHRGRTSSGTPPAAVTGDTTELTLHRGDVVQVLSFYEPSAFGESYCTDLGWQQAVGVNNSVTYTYCLGTTADLTGTTVAASEPVAVVAGHLCSFVPFDNWACDHLEEMMIPSVAWGTTTVMSAPILPNVPGAVTRANYRIVALNDGTTVEFDPPVTPSLSINAGAFRQFGSDQDFVITASGPIFVTQTLLGQDEIGANIGDPAMGPGIPWTQVRSTYDFLTPDTFTQDWVNVVALEGTVVELDGDDVLDWQPIGTTGFTVARVQLDPGAHHIESSDGSGFGITVYGYAPYTSYLFAGGMNFLR